MLRNNWSIYFIILLIVSVFAGCGSSTVPSVSPPGGNNGTGNPGNVTGSQCVPSETPVTVASLSWDAPTTNSDGSALTNLSGYRVYYGSSSGKYTSVIDVGKVTSYVISNLSTGTYFFVVTAYDTADYESGYSNESCTKIQ